LLGVCEYTGSITVVFTDGLPATEFEAFKEARATFNANFPEFIPNDINSAFAGGYGYFDRELFDGESLGGGNSYRFEFLTRRFATLNETELQACSKDTIGYELAQLGDLVVPKFSYFTPPSEFLGIIPRNLVTVSK
jgi:hypothetical protein